MAQLILARHGESAFNAKSLWTGQWDVPLTQKGRHEAKLMGEVVADTKPDLAFTSTLSRAADTLQIILQTNHWRTPVQANAALNERDYGELTGMNKWEVEEKYGRDQFTRWRRGWNEPVPGGETLKTVYARAIPYFRDAIETQVVQGKSALVVAHGNTLRVLLKYLDELSDEAVTQLEMPFGQVIVYEYDRTGRPLNKDIRRIDSQAPPA